MSLLGEDGSCTLLLEEHGGGKISGAGDIILLRVGGSDDHGVEFLPKLDSLGSLAGVIGGHQRWCHDGQGGSVVTGDAAEGERAIGP
jgi:hypothetical protein